MGNRLLIAIIWKELRVVWILHDIKRSEVVLILSKIRVQNSRKQDEK